MGFLKDVAKGVASELGDVGKGVIKQSTSGWGKELKKQLFTGWGKQPKKPDKTVVHIHKWEK